MYKKSLFTHCKVWLKRFRQRRGYGVHSPFAFNFITKVLFERGQYYNYDKINQLPKAKAESNRVCKLLFRLVNYHQPKSILYLSSTPDISDVFCWAKSDVRINKSTSCEEADFIYIVPSELDLKEDISGVIEQISTNSILVIYGIGYSKQFKQYWDSFISHEKAGISFDLYDLGILFFDKEKNKQDYIVNF